ncbi:MAG: hypothetical protein CSA21_07600 [Deltaproteobacteria bacterium]|nr:MAG: hypothetical protein CSA21_07600 [Deltaproteobacteria bacterium]
MKALTCGQDPEQKKSPGSSFNGAENTLLCKLHRLQIHREKKLQVSIAQNPCSDISLFFYQ